MSKKIMLILLGVVSGLIAIEIVFGICLSGYNISNFKHFEDMLHNEYSVQCIRPSSSFGYELIPNSRPGINAYGMYDKEYDIEKKENVFRIIVLGDSITAKYDGYTAILEKKLNQAKDKKFDYEIWNCAFPAYGIKEYRNYLKYRALKYKPDMIIIGFCLNDVGVSNLVVFKGKDRFWEYWHPYQRAEKYFNKYLFRYSTLYRMAMHNLEKYFEKKETGDDFNEKNYKYLKEIKRITKEKNIPLLGIIFPYLMPVGEYSSVMKDQYKLIVGALNEIKINYIDLHTVFNSLNMMTLRETKKDYTHPDIKGHKVVANILYGYIKKYEELR